MEEGSSKNSVYRRGITLALVVMAIYSIKPVCCEAANTALMLQQTPVDGGTVEPGLGVHKYDSDTQVALRAVPKPGYQFVYWLGDVSDPTSSSTTAYLDSPKIIIAVFERVEYEFLTAPEMVRNGVGGSRLYPSAADFSSGGGGGGGAKRPHKYYGPSLPEPPEMPKDFPTPDQGQVDDFPVPDVPEPATIVLLTLGGMLTLMRRKNRYIQEENLLKDKVKNTNY